MKDIAFQVDHFRERKPFWTNAHVARNAHKMRSFVRIFVIALLATFALGTALHVSAAAAMSVTMGLAHAGDEGMGDCKDCPDTGKGSPSCASLCALPLMILPTWQGFIAACDDHDRYVSLDLGLNGRSGTPDPHPPRSIILS